MFLLNADLFTLSEDTQGQWPFKRFEKAENSLGVLSDPPFLLISYRGDMLYSARNNE